MKVLKRIGQFLLGFVMVVASVGFLICLGGVSVGDYLKVVGWIIIIIIVFLILFLGFELMESA